MGTNYYWYPNNTPHCQNCSCFDYERVHIGKKSFGWAFCLHVTGELNSLEKWAIKFKTGKILNEYGNPIDANEMLDIITHDRNGIRDLSRHEDRLDSSGDTYDLIEGEFS